MTLSKTQETELFGVLKPQSESLEISSTQSTCTITTPNRTTSGHCATQGNSDNQAMRASAYLSEPTCVWFLASAVSWLWQAYVSVPPRSSQPTPFCPGT